MIKVYSQSQKNILYIILNVVEKGGLSFIKKRKVLWFWLLFDNGQDNKNKRIKHPSVNTC